MRVELHGVPHDVRHLVVSAVVHALHRVHDAALHGLEAVLDVGHGTFQDDIRGVVQEPVLVHPRQVVHSCRVKPVHGFVVGVGLCGIRTFQTFRLLRILYLFLVFDFVVHISFLVISSCKNTNIFSENNLTSRKFSFFNSLTAVFFFYGILFVYGLLFYYVYGL